MLVPIAYIKSAHGFKGACKILLTKALKANVDLQLISFLWIKIQGKAVPFFVNDIHIHQEEQLIVTFEDIDSKEQIQQYLNLTILIEENIAEQLFDSNRGNETILNYQIQDQQLGIIGIINDITIGNKGQVTLTVTNNDKTFYIPFADDLVIAIDDEKQTIFMNLPEGILAI